jgi:hypothetical protein
MDLPRLVYRKRRTRADHDAPLEVKIVQQDRDICLSEPAAAKRAIRILAAPQERVPATTAEAVRTVAGRLASDQEMA